MFCKRQLLVVGQLPWLAKRVLTYEGWPIVRTRKQFRTWLWANWSVRPEESPSWAKTRLVGGVEDVFWDSGAIRDEHFWVKQWARGHTVVVLVQFVWENERQERRGRSPLMKRSKRETPAVKLFPHFETREHCLHLLLFTSSLFTCGLSHGWLTPCCHTLVPGMIIIARTTNMFSLKLFQKWSVIWTGNWNSWMDG